jgi:hypothetical protein
MIFSVSGEDDIKKALKKIDPEAMRGIIKINMAEIYNRGKRKGGTPVDTGELRQSLGISRQAGDIWVVGYTKEYAPHVEYGHRTVGGGYVKGQHYLRNNVQAQQRQLVADIRAVASGLGS